MTRRKTQKWKPWSAGPGPLAGVLVTAMLMTSMGGCAGEGEPLQREEGAASGQQDAALTTTTMTPLAGPFTLDSTNGVKIVGHGERLHAVYAEQGAVKYLTSTDGITWSAPLTLDSTAAASPTVAVASDGTVGVAYLRNASISLGNSTPSGTIHYRYKPVNGSWSSTTRISSGDGDAASTPSMVAFGTTLHLVWVSAPVVAYLSFPVTQATPLPIFAEDVNAWLMCGTTNVFIPTIAVSRTSAVDSTPLVRVAWFESYERCSNDPTFLFGALVAQRPAGAGPHYYWPEVWSNRGDNTRANTARISLSMAANPNTGDFYFGLSYLMSGTESTELVYENAWNPNDTARVVQLLPRRALISVGSEMTCPAHFRVAVTDITQGSNGYGPAWYRTGTWTGASASGPTWSQSIQMLSPSSRNAHALFWKKTLTSNSKRFLYAMHELQTGSTYSLVNANDVVSPSLETECMTPSPLGGGGNPTPASSR